MDCIKISLKFLIYLDGNKPTNAVASGLYSSSLKFVSDAVNKTLLNFYMKCIRKQ